MNDYNKNYQSQPRFVIFYYLTKAPTEKGKSPFNIYPIKELYPLNNEDLKVLLFNYTDRKYAND